MAADGALHLQLCTDALNLRSYSPIPMRAPPCHRDALSNARLSAQRHLDQVLLVGGSARIPAVQAKVVRMIVLEPSESLNPDECVALGAAVQAGRLGGEMLAPAPARICC